MVSGNTARTRHRLAEWNQNSQGRSSCSADYFSVGGKPKIRLEISENRDDLGQVSDRDNHVILESHGRSSSRFAPLTVIMTCCTATIIILGYIKIARDKKLSSPKQKIRETTSFGEDVDVAPSQTSTTERIEGMCHRSIPCLTSEQASLFIPKEQCQPVDLSKTKGGSGYFQHQISISKSAVDGREVKHLAEEVTSATDIALQRLKRAGHQVEVKDLIPSITQLIISSLENTEKIQQERRRYLFETTQNKINREEAAALHREDSQWMERIQKGCNQLVEEVERSTIRVAIIEFCGRSALWVQNLFKTVSSFAELVHSISNMICVSCSVEQHNLALSASLYASNIMPQSTYWLSCGCRCLFVAFGIYAVLQFRLLLPNIVREIFVILLLGTCCFIAVSLDLVPTYWYYFLVLVSFAYLGAHWQFFSLKKRLRKAFPENNPSSYAVNQALDALETYRRVYAVVPLAFVAINFSELLI